MDPGYKLLQHIKTVPNLINEDPSIVTPKNTSFMDLPWGEFSKLLANQENQQKAKMTRRSSATSLDSASSASSSEETCNWDGMTGFQDAIHSREH